MDIAWNNNDLLFLLLMYWFGKEIYYALAKDPSLSEQAALQAPYVTRDKAAERGSVVHSLIEAWKKSKVVVKNVNPVYRGYVQAFYDWIEYRKPEILVTEKTVLSKKYRYCGTLDMIAMINGKKYIVDFKTNKDARLFPEVQLQLSAYHQALKETTGEEADNLMAVSLGATGEYKEKVFEDNLITFLAAQHLWVWKNQAKCKRVGYQYKVSKKTGAKAVPLHLRNSPTSLMKSQGYGKGYHYPHNYPGHFTAQKYLPEDLQDQHFYRPTTEGLEKRIYERLVKLWGNRFATPDKSE